MRTWQSSKFIILAGLSIGMALRSECAVAITVTSLAQLRALSSGGVNNTAITLAAGEYWLDGDYLNFDPSNPIEPIFLNLGGSGNTYNLSGATIKVDTRDLAGYGRALGHGSGVHLVVLSGNNNQLQGLTLIGEDLDLDTDPNAQRYADWGTQYVKLTGDNNTLDGATVVVRGSLPDTYGLSDAFGKGASQGMQPYIGHRKAAGVNVDGTDADIASNNVVNNLNLTMKGFGHGFFTGDNVENTTLSNSTITGELFPSQMVIDRPEYQEYGHTWWGYPIQDDIMLSGSEGGVRTYGGTNFTVDNVVVDGMRTGFATVATSGDVNITDSYAYNTTSGFDVGNNTTITGSGGNIVNGPLLTWYSSGGSPGNSEIELDLQGGTPIGVNWSAFYVNGNNVDVTLTSSLPAGALPEESYVRLGQKYFENWRDSDFHTATPEGNNPIPFTNSTFTNNTNQMLVIGENATGNVGSSQAPVISNGKENYYDGVTLVQTGSRLTVVHEKGLGNSGTQTGAAFSGNNIIYTGNATAATMDDNGTVVADGGTLELSPGLSIVDEKLTITGDGVDGNGALYSDGAVNNLTRFGDSSAGNESTIVLDGNASIGVGIAGNQMLVGSIQGNGNLTKRGSGKLSIEKDSAFSGTTTVSDGALLVNGTHSGGGDYLVSGGTLGGNGSILASITMESGGTLAPGAGAGSLTAGDLNLLPGATLELEVGGLLAGSEYDQLLANSVILEGDLSVSLLDPGGGAFLPDFSDTFEVLSATSLTGDFENVVDGSRLDTTGGEGSFLVTYDSNTNEVLLSDFVRALLGDLDGNNTINAADWNQFKAGSNIDLTGFTAEAAYQHGDLNGDFVQNLTDFFLFKSSYEADNGPGAFAALLSVPEPATFTSCCLALTMVIAGTRRKTRDSKEAAK